MGMPEKFSFRVLEEKILRKLFYKKDVIRKLLYREEGEYVAHCLEFDLVNTSTRSFEEASAELNELLEVYVSYSCEYNEFQNLYRFAPVKYWIMLQFGTRREDSSEQEHVNVCDRNYRIETSAV